jgi:hypothetical protein
MLVSNRIEADKIFEGVEYLKNISKIGMTPFQKSYKVGTIIKRNGEHCVILKIAKWNTKKRTLCNLVVNYNIKKIIINYLLKNRSFLNITEIERQCGLSRDTLNKALQRISEGKQQNFRQSDKLVLIYNRLVPSDCL